MATAIFYILRNNIKNPFYQIKDEKQKDQDHLIVLSEEVSFLNKGSILQMLNDIPANSNVVIDGTNTKSIHYDVIEIIQNFQIHAKTIGITVELKAITVNRV